MGLADFKGQKPEELSLIEVAHAILEDRQERIAFADLVNEVQKFLGTSDEEIMDRLPQFYTDLNIDGSFISLGDNIWGLRSWYAFESVDEEVNHPEDEEDTPRKKKHKKVNAFVAGVADDDIIDYDDDDPEDEDLILDDEDDEFDTTEKADDDIEVDDTDDGDDEDDDLPDGIEGKLSELVDDDDESDDEE